MFSNNTDDIDFQQLVVDALEAEDDLHEYEIIETTTKLLTGKCHSGMARLPRVGGITTPKEFYTIFDAISFSKLHNLLITNELIWALSGIKKTNNHDDNRRVIIMINSIIELGLIYDDLYTDNRRTVEEDNEGRYVKYPDGFFLYFLATTEIKYIIL